MGRPVAEAAITDGGHAAGRKQAEADGKKQDHQQREPERRHGNSGEAEQVDQSVGETAGPPGRRDARRQGHGHCEQKGEAHQQQGIEKPWRQHIKDRCGEQAGIAEIPLQGAHEPAPVALQKRSVEAVQGAQARHIRCGHIWIARQHQIDRVTRHQGQ